MRPMMCASIVLLLAAAGFAAAPHAPSSTQPAEVTAALDAGKAVALIEVTGVKEVDNRPSDGNLADVVSFKVVKASGKVPTEIRITKAFGGRRIGPAPVASGPLFPNPLVAGGRYWIVFNDSDTQKYPQEVVAWWAEKDAPAALDAAVTGGKFGKP